MHASGQLHSVKPRAQVPVLPQRLPGTSRSLFRFQPPTHLNPVLATSLDRLVLLEAQGASPTACRGVREHRLTSSQRQMPPPSVLVSRNLKSFKTLPSPLGALHERLFDLLAAPTSVALRAAFQVAAPGAGDPALQELFKDPPQIALVQGNVDPSHLLDKAPKQGDSSTLSSRSLASENSSVRPGSWTSVGSHRKFILQTGNGRLTYRLILRTWLPMTRARCCSCHGRCIRACCRQQRKETWRYSQTQ